ncbi:MAG: hypothetical protein HY727_18030, partial [Candidatus Rokubacteria bacterium]|nr:hypothetical protein [Candidatus Rokubacteria bacterium]
MRRDAVTAISRMVRGVARALHARPALFGGVALGVFVLNVLLPLGVLSLARKPVDYATLNPWLTRLPEYLVSGKDPLGKKLAFLSDLALAWFISDNPVEGVEWGFIIDVPSIARFGLTAFLFGAYFALWACRREQARAGGWGVAAARSGGGVGAVMSVFGFSTQACSVMGCGVPVLPVIGLAVTGVSSETLVFFSRLARIGTATV